jgi:hypothetical protein
MIGTNESQLSKNIGNTRRSSRWNRGIRGIIHHFSETIFRDNQCGIPREVIWGT